MIIKTDAAAVTLKRSGAVFNNDSININGKVPSLDSANAGYKGAGSMNTPFAVALSSSERNGFAAAALTAFNDRLPSLKQSANGYAQVLSDYFCDSEYALEKSQCSSSVLATSILYGYGADIVAARMGSSGIYRYSNGSLSSIGLVKKPDDDHVPFSSCEIIENVTDGELFVLCSGGVFSVLQEEEIADILAGANGSAKRAAQGLTAAALSKDGSEDAVSVIVLRVFAEAEPLLEPILPVTPEEAAAAAAAELSMSGAAVEQAPEEPTIVIPEPINNTVVEQAAFEQVTDGVEDEPTAQPDKTNTVIKKILIVILIICGMVALTFATYKIAGAIKNRISGIPEETTIEATTLEESTTQEATTQADTTNENESTTANVTTTHAQVFNPNVNTTTRRVSSTAAPTTQAPTTHSEATTAEPSGDTETTTGENENTTGEAESTTGAAEANTTGSAATAAGDTTAASGEVTTHAGESTAPQSDSTQAAPTEAPTQASTLQTTLEVPLG